MAFSLDQQRDALIASQARLMAERDDVAQARTAREVREATAPYAGTWRGDWYYSCTPQRRYEVAAQGTEIHPPASYAYVRETRPVRGGLRNRVTGETVRYIAAREYRASGMTREAPEVREAPESYAARVARLGADGDSNH